MAYSAFNRSEWLSKPPGDQIRRVRIVILSLIPAERLLARFQRFDDAVHVVHAASPSAAADRLQGGPQPRIIRKIRICAKPRMRITTLEDARPLLWREDVLTITQEMNRPLQCSRVNHDLDPVTVTQLPASASGPTCPMQAPVDTPENLASVINDTYLPKLRCLRAEVS